MWEVFRSGKQDVDMTKAIHIAFVIPLKAYMILPQAPGLHGKADCKSVLS